MRDAFDRALIATADLDARILLGYVLDISQARLISDPGMTLSAAEADLARIAMRRRLEHEPVSKIIGTREFWGRPFEVSHQTLDPRADTETAIEAALEIIRRQHNPGTPVSILDLGTGTGCILLTLLAECENATGLGIDRSEEALEIAKRNAGCLGLSGRAGFICADWTSSLGVKFDIVISNPPYIRTKDIEGLMPDVRNFDPMSALDGGEDGLGAYREIINGLDKVLTEGWVIFELGQGQLDDVLSLLNAAGFGVEKQDRLILSDINGTIRTVAARTAS